MTLRKILYGTALICLLTVGCGRTTPPVTSITGSIAQQLEEVTMEDSDWPWWRGLGRDAQATGPVPPVDGSPSDVVIWRTRVPGRGHATPILYGDRIFITTADEKQGVQLLHIHDRASGRVLRKSTVHQGGFMRRHKKNSHASATPACDGERVFLACMLQNAIWVTATDLNGTVLWQTAAGPVRSEHGYGSSPVLYKSLILVSADSSSGGFIAALNRRTGDIVWRTVRRNGNSYGTPIVAQLAGRDQLLLTGLNEVTSYDPGTGERIWWCEGPADTTANTVAWSDDHVIATGGYPQKAIMCIRADGSGHVGETHILWQNTTKLYVPSPLVVGGRLLVVGDTGVTEYLDLETGRQIWRKRLAGNFSASPVALGDRVFVPNENGILFVFRVGDRIKMLGKHALGSPCLASPVVSGGRLFVRTERELVCIGQ